MKCLLPEKNTSFKTQNKNEEVHDLRTPDIRHGNELFKIVKQNCLAIYKDEELPMESEEHKIFCHQITFMEALSESILQLCLSCLVIREFGLNPFSAFRQLSSLISSLVSTVLAFSKVSLHF